MTRHRDRSTAPGLAAVFTVPRVMQQLVLALLPVVVAHVALFGPGLLLQLAVACPAAMACEALAMRLHARDGQPSLPDGSVLVTAVLFSLCITPLLPWWLTLAGIALAVLLGKHAFGGLDRSPFNSAMIGYAGLLLAFPADMARWPLPLGSGTQGWTDLAGLAWQAFADGADSLQPAWDAYTGATALDALRTGLDQRYTMREVLAQPAFGAFGGAGFQWINLAAAAGGLFLLARRLVRWHIPVAFLAGILLPAWVAHGLDPGAYAGPLFHAFAGATMLGAFFIATDPATAAASDRGRLVYGFGIGFVTWMLRSFGEYPDGVAFAVLLMNFAVPFIDALPLPRIHGHPR